MLNKKFLYGIGIGFLGSKLYPNVKNNFKPIARKIIKTAIIASENTKAFINEIALETKEEKNHTNINKAKKDKQNELTLLAEEQEHAFNRINELKKQLEHISQKVDTL